MNIEVMPPLGVCVYHRPTRQHCTVTAVHRAASQPSSFSVCDRDRTAVYRNVGLAELDPWRDEYPGTTYIWRDLRPGMTIMWWDWPDILDVTAVSEPDEDGMCVIDALQGRVRNAACDPFHEVGPELADLMDSIILDECGRLR